MLPTITDSETLRKRRPGATRRRSPAGEHDEHQHLSRARAHTAKSLAALRRATQAPERRAGLSTPPVPTTVLAAVPRWSSRRHMAAVIRGLAQQPYVIALCRREQIAVTTWVAIVMNDVADADSTGRGMRTSQVVAAARVQRSERTVRRARHVAVKLGLAVEVYRGRELSYDERMSLIKAQPGHQQRGLPNIYCMTVCPPRQRARLSTPRPGQFAQVIPFGHLPPEGGLGLPTHLLKQLSITAAGAAEDAEPPPAAHPRRRSRPGQALAHEILGHPGMTLLSETRPGTLAPQLGAHQAGGWHGLALADALLDEAIRRGIPTWAPARHPWGLLKTLLANVDPIAEIHLHGPADLSPDPCGKPECDGYGWINTPAGAAKCPHCPPAVRNISAHGDWHNTGQASDEPPF